MTDTETTVFLDDNGCPIMDGYLELQLTHLPPTQYPYSEFSTSVTPMYIEVEHELDHFKILHPWHTIEKAVFIPNSPDYVMEIQLFRETCNHTWDVDQHSPFKDMCQHTCMICGKSEQISHEDD